MRVFKSAALAVMVTGLTLAQPAEAEILEYNHAFSYSEIGAEMISYGESTNFLGTKLDMNQAVVNIGQRSGGYTPVSEFGGFYVQTATTLDPLPATEEWNTQAFGVVQTNERKVRWNELNVMASWLFRDTGYQAVGGFGMSTLSFTRAYFQPGPGEAAVNAYLAADPVTYPYDAYGNPQKMGYPPGSVTEDATNIDIGVGLRYDSTFLDPDETTRFLWGVSAGVPVYYKVDNSNFPGVTWVEYFHGYNVNANIGYGFELFEKFMLSTHLDFQYKKRYETQSLLVGYDTAGNGLYGRVPEVTIISTRATVGVEWSY